MRADRFAAVLGVLLAAHDFADHVVQTDAQAGSKFGQGLAAARGMGGHLAGQAACQGLALAGLHAAGVRMRPGRALAGLVLSVGTHGFLDRRWPVIESLRRTGSEAFARPQVRVTEHPDDVKRREVLRDRAAVEVYGAMGVLTTEQTTRFLKQLGEPPEDDGGWVGPLPLHGPYLADQAWHHLCAVFAAAVIAW